MAALGRTCDNFGGNGCRRWLGDDRTSSVAIMWPLVSMCNGNGGIGDGVESIDGDGLDEVRIGGFGPIFNGTMPIDVGWACGWLMCVATVGGTSSMNIALPLHCWMSGGVWNVTLCLVASKRETVGVWLILKWRFTSIYMEKRAKKNKKWDEKRYKLGFLNWNSNIGIFPWKIASGQLLGELMS